MRNLFGETLDKLPTKKKPVNKVKRNWENGFQRWSDSQWADEETALGKCGYGACCDYCNENYKGRPCVRALNAYMRESNISIDYNTAEYESVWTGEYWRAENESRIS